MRESENLDYEQFIELAEKYATMTEVAASIMKNRDKLISTMAQIWPSLSNSHKEKVNKFLVQLHKESMLQLSTEPLFSTHFRTIIQKNHNQRK